MKTRGAVVCLDFQAKAVRDVVNLAIMVALDGPTCQTVRGVNRRRCRAVQYNVFTLGVVQDRVRAVSWKC
jgi:hypothetical protein